MYLVLRDSVDLTSSNLSTVILHRSQLVKIRWRDKANKILAQRRKARKKSWHRHRSKLLRIRTSFQNPMKNQWTKRVAQISRPKGSVFLRKIRMVVNKCRIKILLKTTSKLSRSHQSRHSKTSSSPILLQQASAKFSTMILLVWALRSVWTILEGWQLLRLKQKPKTPTRR